MRLSLIKEGTTVKFNKIDCTEKEVTRLKDFGIVKGSVFKVEKNNGTVIISYKGKMLALGKIIADNIEVFV